MKKLPFRIKRKKEIYSLYRECLSSLKQVRFINTNINDTAPWFIDVLVEMEASKTFHTTSGFTPKEYTAYKNLLRYRIQLLMEIHKRGLEAPSLDK